MILGINTDHRIRGKTFHIQTEDSGQSNPVLFTHVFIGGSIIGSRKTTYEDALGREDIEEHVRSLMRTQHRETLQALMSGAFDEAEKGTPGPTQGDIPLARAKKVPSAIPGGADARVASLPTSPPSRPVREAAPLLLPVQTNLPPARPAFDDDGSLLSSVDVHLIEDESMTMDAPVPATQAAEAECLFPTDLLSGQPLNSVLLTHLLDDE